MPIQIPTFSNRKLTMLKIGRILIVLAASALLIFASYQMLKAQSEPVPPTPIVFEQADNTYSLDYFLPYAKSIVTNYVYKEGGLSVRVFQEEVANAGVTAKMSYANASGIESIQINVNLHDGRTYSMVPIRVKANVRYSRVV